MVLGVKVCGATLGWISDPLSLALGWRLFPGRPHHILQDPTNITFPLTSITGLGGPRESSCHSRRWRTPSWVLSWSLIKSRNSAQPYSASSTVSWYTGLFQGILRRFIPDTAPQSHVIVSPWTFAGRQGCRCVDCHTLGPEGPWYSFSSQHLLPIQWDLWHIGWVSRGLEMNDNLWLILKTNKLIKQKLKS